MTQSDNAVNGAPRGTGGRGSGRAAVAPPFTAARREPRPPMLGQDDRTITKDFGVRRAFFGIALLLLGFVASAAAQTPVLSKSVTIDVTDQPANSATVNHWRNVYGSNARTTAASRALTIMVRNMSAAPGEFEVEWYFVGRSAAGSRRFLYDKGSKPIALKPGSFEKFVTESKELSNYRYHSAYGYVYKSGDKADGWIIRVKAAGEVVRAKASSPQLEQLEKDKPQFEKFVAAMRKSN